MSAYTIELRRVVEIVGRDGLGLNEYPIYNEEYREVLNDKIVKHFWFREIGTETIDMFINRLNEKMGIIMPVYNKLYETMELNIDPLTTTNLTTHVTGTGTDNTNVTASSQSDSSTLSESDSTSRSVASEFPQVQLSETGDYATNANDAVSKATSSGSGHDTSTSNQVVGGERENESTTTMSGYTSNQSALVLAYRETFINVDLMVMDELETLFMQIWDTGEEYGDYPTYLQPLYGAF